MITLLNGSPKAGKSNTEWVLHRLEERLEGCAFLSAREINPETFRTLCAADTVILGFPLYVDSIPSHLLRFLLEWEKTAKTGDKVKQCRLYAVSQCGFFEGEQNRWALKQIGHFADRAGLIWGGGIGIGGGMALPQLPEGLRKSAEKALSDLVEAIGMENPLPEDRFVCLDMPRLLYRASGSMGWKAQAKKNGLKTGDLHTRL